MQPQRQFNNMGNEPRGFPPQNLNELSRFGHSVTLLSPNQVVLFGGAKGLSTRYELCNDAYLFKIKNNTWVKLSPSGQPPQACAAHAAESLEQQYLAVYGGAANQGAYASDNLYILDLSQGEQQCKWIQCQNMSKSPGGRYGHTMIYSKPYLVIFGGNLGTRVSNDVWITDVSQMLMQGKFLINWTELNIPGEKPEPRMYHANALCKHGSASNMIIVFGGRNAKSEPMNDTWGLRRHRNGEWDWLKAPYNNIGPNDKTPFRRYQHTISFYYSFLIVLGGRTDNEERILPIEIYDTEDSTWTANAHFERFRHTSWIVNDFMFTHGGFEFSSPTISRNDIIKVDLSKLFKQNEKLKKRYEKVLEDEKKRQEKIELSRSKQNTPNISPVGGVSNNRAAEGVHNLALDRNKIVPMNAILDNNINNNMMYNNNFIPNTCIGYNPDNRPMIMKQGEIAVVSNKKDDKLIIKTIQFDDKWKITQPINNANKPLHDKFIEYLLRPQAWLNREIEDYKEKFHFDINEISELTNQCTEVVKKQPNVLRISTPVKVFGDIHGQFLDLMTFFQKWGSPCEFSGDIMNNDYLFLGDYVDRGSMSLETICLLMALKIKYPDRIHLLRGNHEDVLINCTFGFQDECERRLNDDSSSEDSLFKLINSFFEYLPLAALIDNEILCLHGGIGANVKQLSDIENINRPFEVIHEAKTLEQKIVMDLLWSDPTDTDEDMGIQPNVQRDSNAFGIIVKYGPDVVENFLKNNKLSFIIRAHECVLDGFERFAGGLLITLFSATDYCGRHKNAGAMLIINQQKNIIPHLIYPRDDGKDDWINDDDYMAKRPPTPPRFRINQNTY